MVPLSEAPTVTASQPVEEAATSPDLPTSGSATSAPPADFEDTVATNGYPLSPATVEVHSMQPAADEVSVAPASGVAAASAVAPAMAAAPASTGAPVVGKAPTTDPALAKPKSKVLHPGYP